LPCPGEPGSHIGGKTPAKWVAVDEDGIDESSNPEMWMWVESEQQDRLCTDDVGPAPAHVASFPHVSGPGNTFGPAEAGDPMFRHYKFQFQSIFIQPPD